MTTVSVTYRAPKGDNKVCEWNGFTFFDGVAQDVEENEQTKHMLEKIATNANFEVGKAGAKAKAPTQAQAPEPKPEPAQPAPAPAPEPDHKPKHRAMPAVQKPAKRTRAHK